MLAPRNAGAVSRIFCSVGAAACAGLLGLAVRANGVEAQASSTVATPSAAPVAQAAAAASPAAAGEPEGAKAARAFQLFDEALTDIDHNAWQDAKERLEQALALAQFPNMVLQLARVNIAMSDYAQARTNLDRFDAWADPNNPRRADARLTRAQLPVLPELTPAAPASAPIEYRTTAPFPLGPTLTVTGGGIALVAALMTGLLSSAADGELARNCMTGSCPDRLGSVRDRGHTLQVTTNVLLTVGLAAVAAGSSWWVLSRPSSGCGGREPCDRPLALAF